MSVESNSSLPVLSCADKLAAQWTDFILLVGRVLMGWIFVSSGWGKLMNIPGFVATMPRRGLPEFLGYVAPPVEFLGGVFLLAGFATLHLAGAAAVRHHRKLLVASLLGGRAGAGRESKQPLLEERGDEGRHAAAVHHGSRAALARLDAGEEALAISEPSAGQRGAAPRWPLFLQVRISQLFANCLEDSGLRHYWGATRPIC